MTAALPDLSNFWALMAVALLLAGLLLVGLGMALVGALAARHAVSEAEQADDAQRVDSVRARLQAERTDADAGDTVPGWLTREP